MKVSAKLLTPYETTEEVLDVPEGASDAEIEQAVRAWAWSQVTLEWKKA